MFSVGLYLDPILFIIPPVRPGLRGHPFEVLLGPSQRKRRTSSFLTRVVKYWNRLPTPISTEKYFKSQLVSAWEELFAEAPYFLLLLFPLPFPPSITQSPFTLSPFMLSQPLIRFGLTLSTLCRPARQTLLRTPIIWSKFSLLLYSASAAWLERSSFQSSAGS